MTNRNLSGAQFMEQAQCLSSSDPDCGVVSAKLDQATQGQAAYTEGTYRGQQHAWNTLPDGSILDATAGQFGEEPVKQVPLYAHQQQDYQLAEGFDPDTGDRKAGRSNNFFQPQVLEDMDWDDDTETEKHNYRALWGR